MGVGHTYKPGGSVVHLQPLINRNVTVSYPPRKLAEGRTGGLG